MYIIWNRKIWGAYLPDQGWRTYTGPNPHTDHVHVSFSWAGALKQTSWWTKADQPASWPRTERGATGVDVQTIQHLLNAAGSDAHGGRPVRRRAPRPRCGSSRPPTVRPRTASSG